MAQRFPWTHALVAALLGLCVSAAFDLAPSPAPEAVARPARALTSG